MTEIKDQRKRGGDQLKVRKTFHKEDWRSSKSTSRLLWDEVEGEENFKPVYL